jgi:hypothetical protein
VEGQVTKKRPLPDLAAQERAYRAAEARTAYLMRYLYTGNSLLPRART